MKKTTFIIYAILTLFVYFIFFDKVNVEFDNPTLTEAAERFGIDSDGLNETLEKWKEEFLMENNRPQYECGTILIKVGDSKNKVHLWGSSGYGSNPKYFRLVKNTNGDDVRELFSFASFVKTKILGTPSGCEKSSGQLFNTESELYKFRYFFEYNINITQPEKYLGNKDYLVSNIDIANKFPYKTGFYPAKYFEINDEGNPSNSGKFLILVYGRFD